LPRIVPDKISIVFASLICIGAGSLCSQAGERGAILPIYFKTFPTLSTPFFIISRTELTLVHGARLSYVAHGFLRGSVNIFYLSFSTLIFSEIFILSYICAVAKTQNISVKVQ
jgi:hypothetical protein